MKRLLIPFRIFFETWFGTCHLYVNSRGHITGNIKLFWFAPRELNITTDSYRVFADHVSIATFTPPAILTHITYVLPTTQPQSPTPTVHIPIKPIAPTS